VATTTASDRLLEGLNEPQRQAVLHGQGPLLVLAGAGSGKTRVLTHRIANLVDSGQAAPGEILAITFTNKAAQEMRERVEQLVGPRVRAMWVMTFHSACARILRSDGDKLGYTRGFTIYDAADSQRLVKRCIEELDIDPKRFTPRAIARQISNAKNSLLNAEAYREMVSSFFEQTAADVYELYEQRIHGMNAMDFDDLLFRCVDLLELFTEVRERYENNFRHVLVDEYQDTNRAQYRWLQLLTGAHRNLCVVGDDGQCLVAGTQITMADGTKRAIEDIGPGDEVLSCLGSGTFGPARVTDVFKSTCEEGVAITTSSGRRLVSTPEHTHFAGYRLGASPQMHLTYLMRKRGKGFRVGTSRTASEGAGKKPMFGPFGRSVQERADATWIVGTYATEAEARLNEAVLSARYGLPTLPFRRRNSRGGNGTSVIASQEFIDEVYSELDTESGGLALLEDKGLRDDCPHYVPQSYVGRRRNVVVTLCGGHNGMRPVHRVAVAGTDDGGREALESLGLKVRPSKMGGTGWRFESAYTDFGRALDVARSIEGVLDVRLRMLARLGNEDCGGRRSLPLTRADSVRPGMVVFDEAGRYDVVESVSRVPLRQRVYDLNVEKTHNFVANGLITHNSIYGFRNADIRNILDFQKDFEDAKVVKLEQNYRSTQTILDAANAVLAHNRKQIPKHLWTENEKGDPIHVRELDDEHAEARYVAGEIERLVDSGTSRDEIAVFYRANAQSRVLEDILVRFNVSYQVIGGTRFYERAEIKDAIAYLTLLVNPSDVVAFERVVNSPKRGIGQTTQARIVSHANTLGETVWDVALDPEAIPGLGAAAIKAVRRFMSSMERLRERMEHADVDELLQETLDETGYLDALRAERTIEAEGRIENLEELIGVAREYQAQSDEPTVEEFLQQLALFSEQDNLVDDEGIVTLMTLHNAKGLEYPVVFMIGVEDGVFPHMRSIEAGDVDEERRLCYVGITRARRELYMTYTRERALYGQRNVSVPSRFIGEIPESLTDMESRSQHLSQTSWNRWGTGAPPREARQPSAAESGASFSVGDDVEHATLGDGVVIGMEPGGLVVVRFAGDGSERKLMMDYAPIKKKA
jgi:DNA helicase II / ATP-dependent DNA helicase PcrA